MKSLVGTVAMAILLVTAGCTGILGGDSTAATPPSDPSVSTPTCEDLNATAVARRHARALRDAGSFRLAIEINGSVTSTIRERARVDVDRGRVLAERSAGDDEANDTHYRDPTGVYSRLVENAAVEYRFQPNPNETSIRPDAYVARRQVYRFVNATEWTPYGPGATGAEDGLHCEARGHHDVSGFENETGDFEAADIVRAELRVGSDGAVRTMAVVHREYDWEAYFLTEYRYRAVGSTVVTPPAWRDQARDAGAG